MELLKEIVSDKKCRGKAIGKDSNIIVIGACNPFRKINVEDGM